jgi:hypothetical protein
MKVLTPSHRADLAVDQQLLQHGRVGQEELRTSCAQQQATAILAAHSSAYSREGRSTTANPPRCSVLFGYGPS